MGSVRGPNPDEGSKFYGSLGLYHHVVQGIEGQEFDTLHYPLHQSRRIRIRWLYQGSCNNGAGRFQLLFWSSVFSWNMERNRSMPLTPPCSAASKSSTR